MEYHVLERLNVKLALATLVPAAGEALRPWLDLLHEVPERWWNVLWMGLVTFLIVRFMARYQRNMKRSPNGEIGRLREEFARKERTLRSELYHREDELRELQYQLNRTNEALRSLRNELADLRGRRYEDSSLP